MRTRNKALLLALCALLLVVTTVFATLAYLTAETKTVKNTFTIGKVEITLVETDPTDIGSGRQEITTDNKEHRFNVVPGKVVDKDPGLIVKADSEDCYLFAKVVYNKDQFSFGLAEGWTQHSEDTEGALTTLVLVREVAAAAASDTTVYDIFANNKVTVNSELTNEVIIDDITIMGLAIQKDDTINSAALAWAELNA